MGTPASDQQTAKPAVDCRCNQVCRRPPHRLRRCPNVSAWGVHPRTCEDGRVTLAVKLRQGGPIRTTQVTLVDTGDIRQWMSEGGLDLQVMSLWIGTLGYCTHGPDAVVSWNRLNGQSSKGRPRARGTFVALAAVPEHSVHNGVARVEWVVPNSFAGIAVGSVRRGSVGSTLRVSGGRWRMWASSPSSIPRTSRTSPAIRVTGHLVPWGDR